LGQSPRSRCYWDQQDHCCVAGQSDLACCKKRTAYCKYVLQAKRVAPSPLNCLMQEYDLSWVKAVKLWVTNEAKACWQTWGVESIFCIHQVFSPYWETLKIGKIWLSGWWLQWGEKPCIIVFFSQFFLHFLLNFYMVTDNGIEKGNAKFQVSLCVLLSVITHLNSTRWRSCATDTRDFKNRLF